MKSRYRRNLELPLRVEDDLPPERLERLFREADAACDVRDFVRGIDLLLSWLAGTSRPGRPFPGPSPYAKGNGRARAARKWPDRAKRVYSLWFRGGTAEGVLP